MSVLSLAGTYRVKGKYVSYDDNTDTNANIHHPVNIPSQKVVITQNGRFFTYKVEDETTQPKLGVLTRVEFQGELLGWQAYLVGTQNDNQVSVFSFIKVNNNQVCQFELSILEAGYDEGNAEQTPKVSLLKGKRLC